MLARRELSAPRKFELDQAFAIDELVDVVLQALNGLRAQVLVENNQLLLDDCKQIRNNRQNDALRNERFQFFEPLSKDSWHKCTDHSSCLVSKLAGKLLSELIGAQSGLDFVD